MSGLIVAGSHKGSMLLQEIRKKYPNYHPIMAIVDLAHHDDVEKDFRLQFECHKTVAKYVEPELKSIEVKGDFKETKTVKISLFDEAEEVQFVEHGVGGFGVLPAPGAVAASEELA